MKGAQQSDDSSVCPALPLSEFPSFLRVLHRLARHKYRRSRLSDDDAINALIVYLARSKAGEPVPKKQMLSREVQATPIMESEEVQATVVVATTHIQTEPPDVQKPDALYHEVEVTLPSEIREPGRLSKENILNFANEVEGEEETPTDEMARRRSLTEQMKHHHSLLDDGCYRLYRLYCTASQ